MRRISITERKLIDRILVEMTVAGRTDYLEYLRGPGYSPRTVEEIDLTDSLSRKGWIKEPCDMVKLNAVYLTRSAWRRFTLDEWQEVEEEIMKSKRGDVYGSW